jgi:hypothetical protein
VIYFIFNKNLDKLLDAAHVKIEFKAFFVTHFFENLMKVYNTEIGVYIELDETYKQSIDAMIEQELRIDLKFGERK